MPPRTIVAPALVAVAAFARPASACTCGWPIVTALDVTPSPDDVAPLNARVRVTLPAEKVAWTDRADGHLDDSIPLVPADAIGFALRAAAKRADAGAPDWIAVRTNRLGSTGWRVLEMTPESPLRPATRFEVVARHAGATVVVGAFSTGDAVDAAPPALSGVTAPARAAPKKPGKGIVLIDMCGSGKPFLRLRVGAVSDDRTRAASIRFAVWRAAGTAPIDFRGPPLTIVPMTAPSTGEILLGPHSLCEPNLDVPDKSGATVRVGLRAVDLAGNASEPVEVAARAEKEFF